ncbi:MAG: fusA 2 [Firmicutes bacterium]|nr:fusA 2 [Bacillota bacterium]
MDTPGYSDFVAEVKGALRAVDMAVVVLCAASGVEVETEKVWKYAVEQKLPRIAFVNKMDRENADFDATVESMKASFGGSIIPLQLPIGSQEAFSGIIDLVGMKAYAYKGGKGTEIAIPQEMQDAAELARLTMIEAAAESDDDALSKYLEGEELTDEEIQLGLVKGISEGRFSPVFCGSALKNIGVADFMNALAQYAPSANKTVVTGIKPKTEEPITRGVNDPFSALVFKTTADPFVGRLSFIRVFSGVLKPDSMLYNATKDKTERIGSIFTMRGKTQDPMVVGNAGDIVVVAKLAETGTGDTLCDKDKPVVFPAIDYPRQMFTLCLEPKNKGDEDKIGAALTRLADEDPTLKFKKHPETSQLLVSGLGDLHLAIMAERLKRKFGVDVKLSDPKIAYRETIKNGVKVEGKHKKQTGGHGQYGHVWLQLDPLHSGSPFEFIDATFGGSVPRQFIPAVEKGVREAFAKGVIAGYPLVDIKVTLTDGSYHDVDSSEMSFKVASALAIRKGVVQAKPTLLEPIYSVEVTVPESYMGDIIGDLNGKRGRILGMEPIGGGLGIVRAMAPMSEMFRYAIDLRSITQGRGSFTMEFDHYAEVPQRQADLIIEAYKKEKQEDED